MSRSFGFAPQRRSAGHSISNGRHRAISMVTHTAAFERIRVLVVDDNHHMINIIKTILRGFGVKDVVEARDAAEAFDIVRNCHIDLIIVDYMMNLLDGADFVRLVRTGEDSRHAFVPIIMLTAYSERSRVTQARDARVTEFCCKPVTAMELYQKVAAVVNNPRPFVKAGGYVGPDRRRRKTEGREGTERRKTLDT
jgi:CheY-like chemotaxis protein